VGEEGGYFPKHSLVPEVNLVSDPFKSVQFCLWVFNGHRFQLVRPVEEGYLRGKGTGIDDNNDFVVHE
jgi:hypothetical protein